MRILTLTAAVMFAACALAQESATKQEQSRDQQAQDQQNQAQRDQAQKNEMPLTTESALKKLHKANHKEIKLGKLAMERGESQEVKNFGQTLVTDHQKANEKVMALAREKNIVLPTAEEMEKKAAEKAKAEESDKAEDIDDKSAAARDKAKHEHDASMQKLETLSGAEFDEEFSQHMLKDHEDTIAFLDRVKAEKNLSDLHALVDEIRPGIQKHAQIAKNLSIKLDKTASLPRAEQSEPDADRDN